MVGLWLLILPFVLDIHVLAAAPNAKDCIEGKVDCADLDNGSVNKDQDTGETSSKADSGDNKGSLIVEIMKTALALLVVLGLIYALLKFLNKRNHFSRVKALENLGGINVGTNKSLQIVRIGSRMYVIGVGENVEMLQEITDEDVKQEFIKQQGTTNTQGEGMITSLFSSLKNDSQSTDTMNINGFKKRFASELDKLKQTRKQRIRQSKAKDDSYE
ncbi:flagellar biosynthetic protein FliO [Lentibacillus sp. N15]